MSPRFKTRVNLQVIIDESPFAQVEHDLVMTAQKEELASQEVDSSRVDLRRRMINAYSQSIVAGAPAIAEAIVDKLLQRLRKVDPTCDGKTWDV